MKKKLKPLDLSGEDPVDQDFSEYLAQKHLWKKVRFIFAPKDRTVTLRLSSDLVGQVKDVAGQLGFPYQALMRQYITEGLVRDQAGLKAQARKRPRARAKALAKAA